MSLFVALSILFTAITTLLIVWLVVHQPYLWVKPSFTALVCIFLHNQVGSAFRAEWVESLLVYPWDYFIMVHLFIPFALLATSGWMLEPAKKVYASLSDSDPTQIPKLPLMLLSVSIFLIVAFYFFHIPPSSTGLYAVVFEPKLADLAREQSQKLLPSAPLRYSLAMMQTALAPMLSVILAFFTLKGFKSGSALKSSLLVCLQVFLLLAVGLSGARQPMFLVLLTVLFAFFLKFPSTLRLHRALLAAALFLCIPATITLFREGQSFGVEVFGDYYLNILDRVFGRSINAGVWHSDYVQKFGFFGIEGVGRLGSLITGESVDVFNEIGKSVANSSFSTMSAGTNFVIAFYACFGTVAFIVSFVLLMTLDFSLIAYARFSKPIKIVGVACCQMAAINLAGTHFTAIFVSQGFLTTILFCVLMSHYSTHRGATQSSIMTSRQECDPAVP